MRNFGYNYLSKCEAGARCAFQLYFADVAQRKSNGIVNRRLWVRFPPSAPKLLELIFDPAKREKKQGSESSILNELRRFAQKGDFASAIGYFWKAMLEDGVEIIEKDVVVGYGTEFKQETGRAEIRVEKGFWKKDNAFVLFSLQHYYRSIFLRRRGLRKIKKYLVELLKTDYDFLQKMV